MARLAALEAARGSFEAAHATVTRRCGPVIGKRQVEQSVVSAAWDIAAFYAARVTCWNTSGRPRGACILADDPAAEDWVTVKALAVLTGDSVRAAAEITAEADAAD